MNDKENKQLEKTVERLEKVVGALERRVVILERENKKLRSAVIAAQTRIASLMQSTAAITRAVNNK